MSDAETRTSYFKVAKRLADIPPYLFQRIDDLKKAAQARGVKITSIGIGDPDSETPPELVDLLYQETKVVANQKYPEYKGSADFRKAVAGWYEKRFGITLDHQKEVLALIGSKEGIANLALAVLDPEDTVIVPDPGYPVYAMHSVFAGCRKYMAPLLVENDFLIDFGRIPEKVARNAKLLWMNYPNNPTSAVAPKEFFDEAVAWAKKYGVILAHDNPYSEIYQSETPPPSILNAKGAMDVAIEFNSLSKTFNMTGWRIGMAVGNEELVQALARVKSNIDSGVFNPIQKVAIKALGMPLSSIDPLRKMYASRRKVVVELLESAGYEVYHGKGTFYVWIRTPKSMKSFDFVGQLIDGTGIITGPGAGWGEYGEGYWRICLTLDEAGLKKAVETIAKEFPAR
jgi:LL-diaminopimelate aminotransferase